MPMSLLSPLYRFDKNFSIDEMIDLYKRSTLGERRPIDQPQVFVDMLAHANLVVTAWHESQLIGIARTLTDFSYVAYLADLAVDQAFQHQGIGQQLIRQTQLKLASGSKIVLLSAPAAQSYYPKIGFDAHPSAWTLKVTH
jgi:ribosomal protein S18 acetylase RimI-like enzyme